MPRRVLEGQVVSDKGDKTVVVNVVRRFRDPLYKKFIFKSKKYKAHDEKNEYGIGDTVLIEECAPISKMKSFRVVELKEKARIATVIEDEIEEATKKTKKAEAKTDSAIEK